MMKNYKKHLIASSIVTLLPILVGLLLWKVLPEKMVTHWNYQGVADGISSKGITVFLLPVIMLIIQWLGIFITQKDRKNRNQSNKVFIMVIWIIPISSLIVSAILLGNVFNEKFDFVKVFLLFPTLLFIVLGNYMPKCKQNYTIGVKVKWTLHNEENWNKTHRFAGWIWFYGGIVFSVILLILPLEMAVSVVFPGFLCIALLPVFYSYFYYRKQLVIGSVTKEEMKLSDKEKKINILSLIVIAIIIGVVLGIIIPGKYEIKCGKNELTVEANLWDDIEVQYDDIEKVEYCEKKAKSNRTFGFGTPLIVMGECENSTWGNHTAYIYLKTEPCIVLRVKGKTIVINEKSKEATRLMYEEIRKYVD